MVGADEDEAGKSDVEGKARFLIGQLIHHRLFDYRGVIADVDPVFQASEEWYDTMAKSRPPKDQPWYHVLVNGARHTTYVAERNLEPDLTGEPITHPLLEQIFQGLEAGLYQRRDKVN